MSRRPDSAEIHAADQDQREAFQDLKAAVQGPLNRLRASKKRRWDGFKFATEYAPRPEFVILCVLCGSPEVATWHHDAGDVDYECRECGARS